MAMKTTVIGQAEPFLTIVVLKLFHYQYFFAGSVF
jgi:hypothetical protein